MRAHKNIGITGVLAACVVASMAVSPHAATADPTASPAAKASARVTMEAGPRLLVRVGPAQAGPGAWKFTLQRVDGDSWERAGDYLTRGANEGVSLPVASGTYRVVVPAQNGYPATTSAPVEYVPTPDMTYGGYGGLEVTVGPIRDWQVTLERKTKQGWTKAKATKTRGVQPMVFDVNAGTYRVRTAANGRFPAYTGKPFDFTPQAPPGPIPYGLIDATFSGPPVPVMKARAATPRAASSSCASVMSSSSAGVDVAVGLINMLPIVGGPLALGVADWSSISQSNAEEACISAQFSTINAQLAFQEGQIEQIQSELTAAQQEFIDFVAEVTVQEVKDSQVSFMNEVNELAACNSTGYLYLFMSDFGFWDGCQNPSGATVPGVATSSTYSSQVSFGEGGGQQNFNENLMDVSGNTVGTCSGTTPFPAVPPQPQPDCYKKVQATSGAQVEQLQQALAAALNANMQSSLTSAENIVPLFDTYNAYLVNYYTQSAVAIQSAYTLESLINQLNYYNAGKSSSAIDSQGEVPGTYYSYQDLQAALKETTPSELTQAQYYNLAQQALTKVYAARMNQLYMDTIGYVVTDDPTTTGGQSWPCSNNVPCNNINARISYSGSVGKSVTSGQDASKPTYSTPLGMLPPVATKNPNSIAPWWTDNAVLYQYYGLRNAGLCYANLLQWNQRNGTAVQGKNGTWYPTAFPSQAELTQAAYDAQCPPILTTSSGGAVSADALPDASCDAWASAPGGDGASLGSCYDGNTLAPYYAADGALPEETSSVLTNLLLCNSTNPSLTWFQVGVENSGNAAGLTEGEWALTCGNWAAPGGPGYPGNKFPQSTPPNSWADPATYSCPNPSSDPYCVLSPNGFWGPFYYWQGPGSCGADCSGVTQYVFNPFTIYSGYFDSQGTSTPAYVPPSTAQPLNIGSIGQTTSMAISSPNCYSQTGNGQGCTITFDPVNFVGGSVPQAELSVLAVTLPLNGGTGLPTGGFALPLTVGAAAGIGGRQTDPVYECGDAVNGGDDCTLIEAWIPSNTSIGQVGYFAPASTVDPTTFQWSQSGYVTVADGSCWNINVGRNANNQGTISFNPMPLGSLCST